MKSAFQKMSCMIYHYGYFAFSNWISSAFSINIFETILPLSPIGVLLNQHLAYNIHVTILQNKLVTYIINVSEFFSHFNKIHANNLTIKERCKDMQIRVA